MLKGFFKKIKDVAGDLSPFAGIAASAFGLGPLYSTLIGAGVPLIAGKGGKEALAGGIGGYFGGQTFGSKGAGTYISPMDILKNTKIAGPGVTQKALARDLALDRLKGAAMFESLDKDNPFRFLPGVAGGLGFGAGLGLFDEEQLPENTRAAFQYDPDKNPFLVNDVTGAFLEDSRQADKLGDNEIFDFLKKMGLIGSSTVSKDGNRMMFETGRSTGATAGMPVEETPSTQEKINQMVTMKLRDPNRVETREFQFNLTTQEKDDIAKSIARDLGISSDSTDFENIYTMVIDADQAESIRKKTSLQALPQFLEMFKMGKADGGGIGDLIEPRDMGGQIGGDRINPTGGRLVGMGAGREDLLDGEIVDPNTGQTQEILVSNNEHVIPEYTLFALGGGDTEKGQQMMDNLRAKTKPQAEAMGYNFQGAEDGSMNYAPVMAQDGKQTAMPGPGMNIQEIVRKMMAQGKSLEEIMSIMSKLNLGMPRQRMPMTAQDGMPTEEVNGLKKLEMQDGTQTTVPNKGSRLSRLEYPKNFQGSFFGGGANMSEYDDFQDPVTFGPGREPTIFERLMNKQGVGFNPQGVVKDPEEFNVSGIGRIIEDLDMANMIVRNT
tara:strand:- start:776 stop:2596 length:1821 start_codon:yes stop_codon:yes gene_type:complete